MLENIAATAPNQLVWMLYYSKVNIVDDLDRALCDILASARDNNRRESITGALMVSKGRFAQTLEGPAAALHRRFERIKWDPRHRFVTVLKVAPANERTFGAWAMALAGSTSGRSVSLSGDTSLDNAISNPTRASDALIDVLSKLVQTSLTPERA